MNKSKVVSDTVSLFDYQFLWEKFKAALDDRDKANADYRALEDENRSLRASFDEAHELWIKATEELASIKARARELFEADKEYDDMMLSTQAEYSQQDCRATEARRRKAMEAFK